MGFLDGHPAGYVINNRTGNETRWKSKGYSLSDEERAELQAYAAQKLEAREKEQKQAHEEAALRVSNQLAKLVLMTSPTPYLQTKQIGCNSEIFTDSEGKTTYIPVIDVTGKVWSMQYISEDGTKRFAKNSRKEGCFHALGGGLNAIAEAPVIVIAEGYATAASISQELEFSTIAAFDAGNLEPVARALQKLFPDKPIVIAGDDDKHQEITKDIHTGKINNRGKTNALKAANAVNGIAIFPIFAPGEQSANSKTFSDFNDLACKSVLGREGVKRQVKSIVENIIKKNDAIMIERKQTRSAMHLHGVMAI